MARKKAATKSKTKTAKKASGRPRRRVAVASREATNGEAPKRKRKKAGQSAKFAPDQPVIPGLEDTDERIPALDKLCESYLADAAKRKAAKTSQDATADDIKQLISEKNLELYIYQGQKFYVEPGADQLKCVVVKQGQ